MWKNMCAAKLLFTVIVCLFAIDVYRGCTGKQFIFCMQNVIIN